MKKKTLLLARGRPLAFDRKELPIELVLEACLYNRQVFREVIQTQWQVLNELDGREYDLLYRIIEYNYLSFLHPSLYFRNLNRLRLIRDGIRWSSLLLKDPAAFLSYIILPKTYVFVKKFTAISLTEMPTESFIHPYYNFDVKGLKKYLKLPSNYRFVSSYRQSDGYRIEFAPFRKGDCRIETYFIPRSIAEDYHVQTVEHSCFFFEVVLLWKVEVNCHTYEKMLKKNFVPSVYIDDEGYGCNCDFVEYLPYLPEVFRYFSLGCQYFPRGLNFNYYLVKDYEGEADELNYFCMSKLEFNRFYEGIQFRNKTCAKIKKELNSYDNWRSERNISIERDHK